MLLAITETGRTISLVKKWDKQELLNITENERILCPSCKESVQLKKGNKRIWHFAHVSKKNCEIQLENESEYHLKGKIQLYDWLRNQGIHVEVEKYLPKIKQRPDLFVTWEDHQYALEFQCSNIESTVLLKRTTAYLHENITPIWILGGNRFKRGSENSLKLTAFDLLMTNSSDNKTLTLIYYCPATRQFSIVSSLTPYSPINFLASVDFFLPNRISFPELINARRVHKMPCNPNWLSLKRRWRTNSYLFAADSFKRIFYENGLPLSLVPSEAGIPVELMIWIRTEPVIWQGWILLEFIIPLKVGGSTSFQEIFQSFKVKVKQGFFVIRQLPSLSDSHYSFAIMDYLQQLEKLGIIEKDLGKRSSFRKIAELIIPKNVEEACELDRKVLMKLYKKNNM
ncbi:MAG TPA: hypothetical protein GXX18_17770 [Bacillales bacterium]|nr:hypothetical protein [Bacillales bacterium]